ncbi:MAG: enoyl-CoA hydratase/isomerase family protein [Chloroflexi bacterium]|nr:enoyl-CoA hydratase/isomerase family protein [Chloroflexota bacterium]
MVRSESWIVPEHYDGVMEIPLVGEIGLYLALPIADEIKSSAKLVGGASVLYFNVDGMAAESLSEYGLPGLISWLLAYPQPTVFGVHGNLRDSALELAMACDIRVVTPSSAFALSHISRGQMPNDGGVQMLTRLVGPGIAKDMLLTGRELSGDEGLNFGLVSYLDDDPTAKAKEIAMTIAKHGTLASKYTKEAVNSAGDMTFGQGARLEADLSFLLHGTLEREEGLAAFRAGRTPNMQLPLQNREDGPGQ